MKKLFIFLIFLSSNLLAQQIPVDCRILLMPPYSGNLADYTAIPTVNTDLQIGRQRVSLGDMAL